jgi:peptidoglycan/LPS O-acetylase OafA/YrhL
LGSPSANRAAIAHVPALDGLRGAALLGVLFFHADGALRGGYLGVDLFFVLSGYLITSILLAEHRATGTILLSTFWVRRARRLFPALLSLMPAVALYARFLAKPDELAGIRRDALATLGYVANWRAIFANKSYWELFAAPSPLEHTWSLSIEEQFYVLWPLVVVLVLVVLRQGPRVLLWLTLGLGALSVAAMVLLFRVENTSRAYLGTDTRAAAILAGAALATLLAPGTTLTPRARRALEALGFVALAVLAVAWARLDGQSPLLYRGGFWLTEVAALVLIACGVTVPSGSVARILSLRPLTLVGTISYGLYLWHWPVNVVLTPERVHVGPIALNLLRFTLTFAIAIVSYRFLERPIRTRGLPFGRPAIVVPAAVLLSVLLVVRGTYARHVAPGPLPSLTEAPPQPAPWSPFKTFPSPYSVNSHTLPPAGDLRPGTLRFLTLGDSVAIFLGVALRYRQESIDSFVAERGVGDCSILAGLSATYFAEKRPEDSHSCSMDWAADVRELHPDVTLIVLGGGFFARIHVEDQWEDACEAGWRSAYRDQLVALLDAMAPHAGRVVIALVPYPLGRWRSEGLLERVDCFNDTLKEVARLRGLPTIDLKNHVCPTNDCVLLSDGEPIRPDGLHFDGIGAEETARWTLAQIRRVIQVDGGGPLPGP